MSKCILCRSFARNELALGELHTSKDVVVHQNCLYLSSNLVQEGDDKRGICCFLPKDIKAEAKRTEKLICCYCRKPGANIGCCKVTCRRTFHTYCGIQNLAQNQYTQSYKSFCNLHIEAHRERPTKQEKCAICFNQLIAKYDSFHCTKYINGKCCKTGWYHKDCLQRYAYSAGYFFKCPLCNDSQQFRLVVYWGITVPDRDASWELADAFADQLEVATTCTADVCQYKPSRKSLAELYYCNLCGGNPMHPKCTTFNSQEYCCNDCVTVENNRTLLNNTQNPLQISCNITEDSEDVFEFAKNEKIKLQTPKKPIQSKEPVRPVEPLSNRNRQTPTPVSTVKEPVEVVRRRTRSSMRLNPDAFQEEHKNEKEQLSAVVNRRSRSSSRLRQKTKAAGQDELQVDSDSFVNQLEVQVVQNKRSLLNDSGEILNPLQKPIRKNVTEDSEDEFDLMFAMDKKKRLESAESMGKPIQNKEQESKEPARLVKPNIISDSDSEDDFDRVIAIIEKQRLESAESMGKPIQNKEPVRSIKPLSNRNRQTPPRVDKKQLPQLSAAMNRRSRTFANQLQVQGDQNQRPLLNDGGNILSPIRKNITEDSEDEFDLIFANDQKKRLESVGSMEKPIQKKEPVRPVVPIINSDSEDEFDRIIAIVEKKRLETFESIKKPALQTGNKELVCSVEQTPSAEEHLPKPVEVVKRRTRSSMRLNPDAFQEEHKKNEKEQLPQSSAAVNLGNGSRSRLRRKTIAVGRDEMQVDNDNDIDEPRPAAIKNRRKTCVSPVMLQANNSPQIARGRQRRRATIMDPDISCIAKRTRARSRHC